VFECLGSTQATGASGGGVAVPGGVGAEVTFTRSHLVYAARGDLVKAHERVGPQRELVRVSSGIWGGHVPFFHEEVHALEFKQGVGAAPGGLGVVVGEQMLRGNGEGSEPVRA